MGGVTTGGALAAIVGVVSATKARATLPTKSRFMIPPGANQLIAFDSLSRSCGFSQHSHTPIPPAPSIAQGLIFPETRPAQESRLMVNKRLMRSRTANYQVPAPAYLSQGLVCKLKRRRGARVTVDSQSPARSHP